MSIKEKILKPAYVAYAKFLESNKKRHLREMYRQGVARGEALRKKDVIKVLFILTNLPKWKTEPLYLAMREHPRFDPMIGVAMGMVDYPAEVIKKIEILEAYLKEKSYPFKEIFAKGDVVNNLHPDIVLYQEAGWGQGGLNSELQFQNLENCAFCYISYAFLTASEKKLFDYPLLNSCWLNCVENEEIKQISAERMTNKGTNLVVTGLPMADILMAPADNDPWKAQDKPKKRIIWSAHHTIGTDDDVIHYGNFLRIADFMIEIAQATQDQVQWAFEPHPSLKRKLYQIWGEEKTEAYFNRWNAMPNTQLNSGSYIDLFKHSDAIIHDCGSFTIEYLYMHKPCMYVYNGNDLQMNTFAQKAWDLYYKGYERADIEQFVQNVIAGIDPRRDEREAFFAAHLLPPNGRTATENVIAAILGEKPYDKI